MIRYKMIGWILWSVERLKEGKMPRGVGEVSFCDSDDNIFCEGPS